MPPKTPRSRARRAPHLIDVGVERPLLKLDAFAFSLLELLQLLVAFAFSLLELLQLLALATQLLL